MFDQILAQSRIGGGMAIRGQLRSIGHRVQRGGVLGRAALLFKLLFNVFFDCGRAIPSAATLSANPSDAALVTGGAQAALGQCRPARQDFSLRHQKFRHGCAPQLCAEWTLIDCLDVEGVAQVVGMDCCDKSSVMQSMTDEKQHPKATPIGAYLRLRAIVTLFRLIS